MKDQFTISLRKIGTHLALSMFLLLLLSLSPGVSMAQNTVDIGLFNSTTTPNQVEVRIRPDFNSTMTLTNIQFTVRWDATAGVTITPGSTIFPYFLAGATSGTLGGYSYQSFASVPGQNISWVAGNEYVVATFTYNTCTGFELAPAADAWVQGNNGEYYVEMFTPQLVHTGTFYATPLVCISLFPAAATNPVPANGAQYVAYNGNQIGLGWDYVSDPLFNDPDSFLVAVTTSTGNFSFTVPFVNGQTTYANAVQISPLNLSTVTWTVTPFNNNGNAGGVSTWSFTTAPSPLMVDVFASGPNTICTGGSTTLMADPSGGLYPMSFAWSPSASLNVDTLMQPLASPMATTTYTVTVTDALGSTVTGDVTIVVNEATASFSADPTICEGECTLLVAFGGMSYAWATGENTASINVCPTQNATYTVTVTDTNGCTVAHTFNVTVNPLPMVSLGAIGPFCASDDSYLMTEGVPAGGVYSGAGVNVDLFNPSNAGVGSHNITYSFTDTNGCVNTDTAQVNVLAVPLVTSIDLKYSSDNGTTYSSAGGDLGTGYNMCLDPSLAGSYLLDVNTMVLNPAGSLETGTMNAFTLTGISNSAAFFAYWAGRGVDASANSGWQQLMWQIINGNAPFFYVKNTGSDIILVDGLMYSLYGGEPILTLPGDYPEATYTYNGSVVGSNGCAGLPFDVMMTFNTMPSITSLDLLYSADNGTTYSSAAGNLGTGYNMCIDPSLSGSYLLDVNNMVLNPVGTLEVGTMNPFTLASISDSAAFFAYWAGRGVDASAASGWQQLMWQIINGNAPFFYLKNTGTDNILVDGLMYALYGGEPVLTLPGDYPEATYTYHGSVVGSNGCAGLPFDVQMTFNTKPVVSFPGLAAVCLDATAFTLTGASPLNGIYSGTGVSNGMFDPAVAGVGVHTLNYSYTSTNGCSGMASTTIEVFPAVMASAGQDVTLCAGDCADLTATGGVSYTWNTPAQTAMINVCPAQTTTYSVTVTDINGCQDVDDVTVFVNPLPQVSASAVQAICAGVCTPITATGGVTYLWSNESTGSTDTVCPVQTTTYTVTATDVNGCQNQASVTISVNPLPNVDLPSFAGVCVDAAAFSLTTGTPAGGVYSGHGVSNNMFNPAAAGVGVHTIYYSYADNIGCSGIDSATITVFALPMANAGMDITICEGSCTDLTATGGVSYVWSNGAQTAINNVCPAQQTTFTVTVTDANGCVATDDVMVSLFTLPVADAGADQSICAGDCINLLATGGVSYAWPAGQTGASINVCPAQTTTYVVTVTDVNGCQDIDDVTITVDPVPVANAGPDAAICVGDCATLTASGGASFLWSTGETTASITVCPIVNTTYYVTVSNAGCTAVDEVTVNTNPAAIISGQPADLAVDLGATASFTVVSTGASFIQWEVSTDGGNTWTPTVDGSVYQGSATGTLIIGVTTLNLDGYMFKAVLGSPCGPSVVTSSATLSVVAPVISALLPNMTSCANEVVVPIIVVKTIGIGAISLTLNFDPSVLVYDSYQNLHPSLLNGYVTVVNTTANSVYFSWYSINPLNIIYDTLVELVFHSPNGGTSALNWDLATPGNCEFSDVATNVIPATFFAGSVVAIPSPAVTINPMDADITEGQNTSFSVTATNATAYQWQMSDDGGTSWYNLSDGAMYQGTQTSTLNIFGATVYMDEYEYRCVVSGTCSPDDVSNAANLNVRPIITTYIGQEVRCADDVIIPVYITHGYGVAGISLTLGFNTMVLNYVGLHSSHPDLVVGILNDNSTFGRVYISWYSTTPIDLGDTVLLKLRFTANPGSSSLVWDLSAPDNCQYNNLANEVIQTVWQNGFVTVNQTPLVYNVTGGGEYCAGGAGAVVGLAGSQNGLAYALMLDSVPTGQVVNGTGAAISFGPQMAAGVYTVVATNLVTGCDSEMQGSKTVVINPLPVANAGGDASMLLGTSILLEGSATNGTPSYAYMWTPGGMMTSDVTVSPSATQTYTLQVTDSKGCMDTDDVTVSVYSNTISGQVTYDNLAGTPMSNVTVYLNNDSKAVVATTTTNASGYYSFPPVVNGMYTITATTNKAWGGVNSTDALAIMQHFIKIDSLEGLALMAADVDGSGFINTTDAFNAARRFAQLINSFPVGDWVFEEKTVTLDENDMVTVDFMALCYGDVNRSHVPAAKLGTALNLTHKNIIPFAAGKEVILPVTLNTSAQLGAISMVLEVPAGITITDVSADYTRDLIWTMNANELRVSWYSTNPVNFRQDDAIMSIRMVVAPGFQGEAAFILGDESELAGARADVLENIGLDMPKLASGAVVNGLSLRNYPNPFRGVTSITYALPQDGNVNLSVYNILGEEVANLVNSHQASGQYTVDFNAGNLMPGIYQYRLQLNGKSETTITRTMIVTE